MEVDDRLVDEVGALDKVIRPQIRKWLEDDPHRAQAAVWALKLLAAEGWRPTGIQGHAIAVKHELAAAVLVPVGLPDPQEAGEDRDLQRLLRHVEDAVPGRRLAVHLHRTWGPGADPTLIASAATACLNREAQLEPGTPIALQDAPNGFTVALGRMRVDDGRARVLIVPPTQGLEQLDVVAAEAREAASTAAEAHPDQPVVLAVGSWAGKYAVPRAAARRTLYGAADRVLAEYNGHVARFDATYPRSKGALFAERDCRNLAAVWWLGPGEEDDQYPEGFSDENPWYDAHPDRPPFSGSKFVQKELQGTQRDGESVGMRWVPSSTSTISPED